MKANKVLLLIIAAIASLLNTEADANISPKATKHWYVGGSLGTQLETDGNTHIPSIDSKPPLTSEPVYDNGYTLGLNVGYKFHQPFRVEGELVYQDSPMEKINNAIGPDTVTYLSNSNTELFSLFINSYYDFRLGEHWIPYLGVGIGYSEVRNTINPNPPIPVPPGLFFTKKELNYNAAAYQGILGLGYQFTQNIIFSLKYKYFSTFETKSTGQTNLGTDSYETKQSVSSNIVLFGINYFFA